MEKHAYIAYLRLINLQTYVPPHASYFGDEIERDGNIRSTYQFISSFLIEKVGQISIMKGAFLPTLELLIKIHSD